MGYSTEAVFRATDNISSVIASINRGYSAMHTSATTVTSDLDKLRLQHEALAVRMKYLDQQMNSSTLGAKQVDTLNTALRNTYSQLSNVEAKMRQVASGPGLGESLFGKSGAQGFLSNLFGGSTLSAGGQSGILGSLMSGLGGGAGGLGATIGSLFGPVGTIIGGIGGNLFGGLVSGAQAAIGAVGNILGGLGNLAMAPIRMLGDAVISGIGGAFNFVGGVIQYTLGSLLSAAVQGALGLISSLAGEAFAAYSGYEQLGYSVQALVARELQMNSVTEKSVIVGYAHAQMTGTQAAQVEKLNDTLSNETFKRQQLSDRIALEEQSLVKLQTAKKVDSLSIARKQEELQNLRYTYGTMGESIAETQSQIENIAGKQDALVPIMQKVSEGGMSMSEALGQAGPKAQELLSWLTRLSILSPFGDKAVQQSFQLAMSFGNTIVESKRQTQALIDFAAATGKSQEIIDRMALSLGQMKAMGKMSGEELRELTMAGLPIRQVLARELGVSVAQIETMIQSGAISAEKGINIVLGSIEKDFGGSAERMAGTWQGLMTSFDALKKLGLRELFGGALQAVQPIMQYVVDLMSSDTFLSRMREWGKAAGDFAGGMVTKFKAVIEAGSLLVSGGVLGKSKGRGILASVFGDDVNQAQEIAANVGRIMELIKTVPTLFKAIGLLRSGNTEIGKSYLFDALSSMFSKEQIGQIQSVITGGLPALGPIIFDAWNTTVRPFLSRQVGEMFSWLTEPQGAIDAAGGFVTNIINGVASFLSDTTKTKDLMKTVGAGGEGMLGALARVIFGSGQMDERTGVTDGGLLGAAQNLIRQITWSLDSFMKDKNTIETLSDIGQLAVEGIMSVANNTELIARLSTTLANALITAISLAYYAGINTFAKKAFGIDLPKLKDDFSNFMKPGTSPHYTPGVSGRAFGGPVFAGVPLIVGENGPELWVPRFGGNIVSNQSVRENTDNRKSSTTIIVNEPRTAAMLRDGRRRKRTLEALNG